MHSDTFLISLEITLTVVIVKAVEVSRLITWQRNHVLFLRYDKEVATHKKTEDALKAALMKLSDREGQLAAVNQEAKNLEAVIQELRKECQELKDALESAKYALEQETLSRVDLESKLQLRVAELLSKNEKHEKVRISTA